ncbi:MAG: RagB/SusD family nutrient uptake outer membrane protein, partial [Mucilaginibacter sp.]
EARFLRAWYYFTLLKHYGGMPIVGDTIFDYTDKLPAKRATFRATVNYIVSECDAAATVLPYQQAGPQYGRVSGGACAALKSRVLLYAASKLFNGTTLATGELGSIVGYPNDSLGRWGMARDAALAVMNTGQYSLNVDNSKPGKGFQDLFPKRINSEYILNLMFENNTYIENLFFPPSRDGRNGSFPYQGLVDAFPMANGKSITDPTSGYDATKPYNNRDPRLAFSVIRDSSLVLFRTPNGLAQTATPISIFVRPDGTSSGQDAFPTGTRTGYYNFKMADPAAVPSTFFALSSRCIPLIRYAEILLNYAEAQNEFNGGPDQSVYDALFKIRDRAGIAKGNGSYGLKVPMSQTEMRDAIRNERRIELAFEEQRFWDVRRWMIADQTDNIEAKGMKVTRANQAAAPTYEIVTIKRHNFRKAMYLWPLPQKEIDKSAQLLQNPGY